MNNNNSNKAYQNLTDRGNRLKNIINRICKRILVSHLRRQFCVLYFRKRVLRHVANYRSSIKCYYNVHIRS